ncbi:MAG TPA: hypothetical protein VGF23_25295, partial [Gaiellaceae bacterium]
MEQIAREALLHYDLPRPVELRPIRLLNNAVFEVVGDGVRLALRIHRPGYRGLEHVRSELTFLDAAAEELRDSRITVPRPLAARNGELIVCVGERSCDLLTWADGRVLKHGRGLGPRSTFLLGEGLGRLHDAAERLDARADLELPRWDAETMFSEASPFRPG